MPSTRRAAAAATEPSAAASTASPPAPAVKREADSDAATAVPTTKRARRSAPTEKRTREDTDGAGSGAAAPQKRGPSTASASIPASESAPAPASATAVPATVHVKVEPRDVADDVAVLAAAAASAANVKAEPETVRRSTRARAPPAKYDASDATAVAAANVKAEAVEPTEPRVKAEPTVKTEAGAAPAKRGRPKKEPTSESPAPAPPVKTEEAGAAPAKRGRPKKEPAPPAPAAATAAAAGAAGPAPGPAPAPAPPVVAPAPAPAPAAAEWGNITLGRAMSQYGLSRREMDALDYRAVRNPHYRSAAPMRLYNEGDVYYASQAKYAAKGTTLGAALAKRAAAAAKRQETIARNERERAEAERLQWEEAARLLAERTAALNAALQARGIATASPRMDIPAWYNFLYHPTLALPLEDTVKAIEDHIAVEQLRARRRTEHAAAFEAARAERGLEKVASAAVARYMDSDTLTLEETLVAYEAELRALNEQRRRQALHAEFARAVAERGLPLQPETSPAYARYLAEPTERPLADVVEAYAAELFRKAELRRAAEQQRGLGLGLGPWGVSYESIMSELSPSVTTMVRDFSVDASRHELRMTGLDRGRHYVLVQALALHCGLLSEGDGRASLVLRKPGGGETTGAGAMSAAAAAAAADTGPEPAGPKGDASGPNLVADDADPARSGREGPPAAAAALHAATEDSAIQPALTTSDAETTAAAVHGSA